MSVPEGFKCQTPNAQFMFASFPNEEIKWDILPLPTGELDWYCPKCGEPPEQPVYAYLKEPCQCPSLKQDVE